MASSQQKLRSYLKPSYITVTVVFPIACAARAMRLRAFFDSAQGKIMGASHSEPGVIT